MQIQFKTLAIPTRAVKRIKRLAAISESEARQWTAEVLGYRNWHEFGQRVGLQAVSPLDEDSTPEDLAARREFQLQRLQACLSRTGKSELDASQVLSQWQPSAAHPQVSATSKPQEDAATTPSGHRADLATLLLAVHERPSFITSCVEKLLPLLRDCKAERSLKLAADVSIGVLRDSRKAAEKQAARRVLEVVASKEVPIAWFNLAMSLMLGDAGPKDEKRAVDLLQRLLDSPLTPDDLRARARSLVATAVAEGIGRPADPAKARAGWEAAVAEGDMEAAFNAGLSLQGRPGESVTPQNMAKAVEFYRTAAQSGHVYAATNLGLALLAHKELEAYPMEGLHWIEAAAQAGDANASAALKVIRKQERDVLRMFDRGELSESQVRATFERMEQLLNPQKRR